ncbi:hypothetical protein CHLRE_09g408851v5 [Chlamydomonas reinhardtii]|uniref:Uncharacterized protein n=1 Tax=Chlamydomonas reinhardtii TaxID=3055 RepID=A0A2K3DFI5_CHLRE|nr:uncharacterized protein CHLRE_09g408851v5 [Chlamydomonas reinhardtii]PNW79277.1 hypothetical protein CHLRE_09g408851v5 [Chlamydomonas reinhardtii]
MKAGTPGCPDGQSLVPLLQDGNLVSKVWGADQPPAPCAPLRVHDLRWAGEEVAAKLGRMREQMKAAGAGALLATALDEVAWLTNTRGGDVDHNPVALSYCLVTPESATLYVDGAKVGPEVAAHLAAAGVEVATGATVTEVEVDLKLTGFRAAQPGFVETSFSTIAGAGPNGAIIHYRAQPGSCRSVDGCTLLLLDSGGQYECGTTDITRTLHTGSPTEHQRRCNTRVLQGHIALDVAVWPEGTPGAALDAFARMHLWRDGLNYRHGTGHGVGAALNVHEGPQSISSRFHITTPLAANMVCSNEPGYYEDGSFGVRIENLVVVVEKDTPYRYAGQQYLGFQRLTMVPIQAKLIDTSLLSAEETAWVDGYHREVWEAVSPRMQDQPELLEWLRRNTRPLKEQLA